MASKIQVSCPNCNAVLEAQEEWIGMESTCPNCNQTFKIADTAASGQSPRKDRQEEYRKRLEDKHAERLEEKKRQLEWKEKRRKIERFFRGVVSPKKKRIFGFLVMGLGILGMLIGFISLFIPILYFGFIILLLFLGIFSIMIGGFLVWQSNRVDIDETEFDLYAEEDMAYIESLNVLKQYGKDVSELVAEPYTMIAPDFEGGGLVEFAWRLGDDGRIRYSVIEITKAFLFEHQLIVFTASWDFIKGILMNEKTYAYFYKDIVAINTSSEYDKTSNAWFIQLVGMIPWVGEYIAAFMKERTTVYKTSESFELISSSGISIELGVGFDDWVLAHGGQVQDKTDAEVMVRAIRKMVEEKKNS